MNVILCQGTILEYNNNNDICGRYHQKALQKVYLTNKWLNINRDLTISIKVGITLHYFN